MTVSGSELLVAADVPGAGGAARSLGQLEKLLRALGYRVTGRSRGELDELLGKAEQQARAELAVSARRIGVTDRSCSRCGDPLSAERVRDIGERRVIERLCPTCLSLARFPMDMRQIDPYWDGDTPPSSRRLARGNDLVREGNRYYWPIPKDEHLTRSLVGDTRIRVSTPVKLADGAKVTYAALGGRGLRGPLKVGSVRLSLDGHSDAWEREGPWGGSLAWLEEQNRPEPWERCPRCNWRGRFIWLVGRDDFGEPSACLRQAHPGSVGARKPLLEQYAAPSPCRHDHVGRGGACVLCAGKGFLVPLSWNTGPRLRRRPPVGLEDADDLYDLRIDFGTLDDDGRLSGSPSSRHGHVVAAEAAPETGVIVDPSPSQTSSSAGITDEVRLIHHILRLTHAHVLGESAPHGWQAAESLANHAEAAPVVQEPLALRQFLIDLSIRPGGRRKPWRQRLFRQRDGVVFELVALGFPIERVGRAVGLAKTRLYDVEGVQTVLNVLLANRRGLIADWSGRGYSSAEIAAALRIGVRTVQRVKKELRESSPFSDEYSLAELPALRLVSAALVYPGTTFGLQVPSSGRGYRWTVEDFRGGAPIDLLTRAGRFLPAPPEGDVYHSWPPGDEAIDCQVQPKSAPVCAVEKCTSDSA